MIKMKLFPHTYPTTNECTGTVKIEMVRESNNEVVFFEHDYVKLNRTTEEQFDRTVIDLIKTVTKIQLRLKEEYPSEVVGVYTDDMIRTLVFQVNPHLYKRSVAIDIIDSNYYFDTPTARYESVRVTVFQKDWDNKPRTCATMVFRDLHTREQAEKAMAAFLCRWEVNLSPTQLKKLDKLK